MSEIGLFEAMYSARALRRFKADPVPEEVLTRILDAATRAPSAGNSQNWSFIVVRDREQRQRLPLPSMPQPPKNPEVAAAVDPTHRHGTGTWDVSGCGSPNMP